MSTNCHSWDELNSVFFDIDQRVSLEEFPLEIRQNLKHIMIWMPDKRKISLSKQYVHII